MENIMESLKKAKLNLRLLGKLYPKMGKSVLYQLVCAELHKSISMIEEKEKL